MNENTTNDPLARISSPRMILVFFLFNLVWKLAMISINRAEYTDGILQITLFSLPVKSRLYPPLFTLCVMALKPLFGNPETAGRFISILASSITAAFVFIYARYIFDKRTAFFAALVYTVSPLSLRWSLHAMTDGLFTLFFLIALGEGLRAFCSRNSSFTIPYLVATLASVLATLTRYQGIFFFPFLLWILAYKFIEQKKYVLWQILVQVLWFIPFLWILIHGFSHTEQFTERSGSGLFHTGILIWNLFESFLCYAPYFFTWLICFFFLVGLFHLTFSREKPRVLFWLFLYFAITLLLLQSAFSSFQSRYLLPLVPLVAIFGAHGMSWLKEKWKKRPFLFQILILITVIYGMGFGLLSVFLQREVFGDLKQAAVFIRQLPEETKIYSNESYKDMGAVKMRFWSGRDVKPYIPGGTLPSGSVLCLSSAYGGAGAFARYRQIIREQYQPKILKEFEAEIVPLLPDVMQEPFSHQNPMALTLRYTLQSFRTEVLLIP